MRPHRRGSWTEALPDRLQQTQRLQWQSPPSASDHGRGEKLALGEFEQRDALAPANQQEQLPPLSSMEPKHSRESSRLERSLPGPPSSAHHSHPSRTRSPQRPPSERVLPTSVSPSQVPVDVLLDVQTGRSQSAQPMDRQPAVAGSVSQRSPMQDWTARTERFPAA